MSQPAKKQDHQFSFSIDGRNYAYAIKAYTREEAKFTLLDDLQKMSVQLQLGDAKPS